MRHCIGFWAGVVMAKPMTTAPRAKSFADYN
jgi:hypothetical protein